MSYIDALYKRDEDKIYVVERDPKKGTIAESTMCNTERFHQRAKNKIQQDTLRAGHQSCV